MAAAAALVSDSPIALPGKIVVIGPAGGRPAIAVVLPGHRAVG